MATQIALLGRWPICFAFFAAMLAGALTGQTIVVNPYVQPGDGATLGRADVKVIAWMTDQTPGLFTVEVGLPGGVAPQVIRPENATIQISEQQRYVTYAAKLSDLPLNSEIHYRVKLGEHTVAENSFLTRKTPDQPLRFVVVGDLADGSPSQRLVAHQMAQVRPEFAMLCGDIVYVRGRLSEYLAKFWPVYNYRGPPGAAAGETLMQSVPFYVVLGNHDTEEADLAKIPDAFAAFYFFHPPRNAPAGPWTTPIIGEPEQVQRFKSAAGSAGFPHLSLYSFDNGPAHFLVLDSDGYLPLNNAELREWIRRDLAGSTARWKLVFYHHPGFNSTAKHGGDQRLRLFAPLFEEGGVDLAFAGHVHNYQRSKPLRFSPNDPMPAQTGGKIRGTFAIDEDFDGQDHTVAHGVIYIVTGGGGATLYPMQPKGQPAAITPDPDAPNSFTAKFVDDRHSFSLLELDATKLVLRQIDEKGLEIDRITLTKAVK